MPSLSLSEESQADDGRNRVWHSEGSPPTLILPSLSGHTKSVEMLWVVSFLLPQDCISGPRCENAGEGNALYQQPYSKPAHLALCIILKNPEKFLMLTPKIQSSSKDLFSLLLLDLTAIPSTLLIRKNTN